MQAMRIIALWRLLILENRSDLAFSSRASHQWRLNVIWALVAHCLQAALLHRWGTWRSAGLP